MARLASLTADASAPTELSEQKAELATYPKVIKLGQRNRALTERIRRENNQGCSGNEPVPDEEKSRGPLEFCKTETAGEDNCAGPEATLPDS